MHSGRILRVHQGSSQGLEEPLACLVRSKFYLYIEQPDLDRVLTIELYLAAMGATFALTESVVANTREKDDALNGVAGGCAAGFLAGIRG